MAADLEVLRLKLHNGCLAHHAITCHCMMCPNGWLIYFADVCVVFGFDLSLCMVLELTRGFETM